MGKCLICNKYRSAMHNKNTCCFCFVEKRKEINNQLDILIDGINRGEYEKMKREKHDIGTGMYLKPSDIEDGEIGDRADIEIVKDGEIRDGDFGERFVIGIKVNNEEKELSLSPTNENIVIDLLGSESEKWINKSLTIMVESCNVGSGKMITVLKKKKK